MPNNKMSILGLGYIGLPTAMLFASSGYDVAGYDKNETLVRSLNQGKLMIEEPGLEEKFKSVVESGHFKAYDTLQPSDIYIICVPTPINPDKSADVTYVKAAAAQIAPLLKKADAVVLESTSPVGTTDGLIKNILEENTGLKAGADFYLGHSPERVLPGKILRELVENDRIVGGIDGRSAEKIESIYKSFVKGNIHKTDSRTAELAKLSENTFRDVNIALANELALFCEKQGIDVFELVGLVNNHPRVNLHTPGPGVGGHCIAVDPWFIIEKQDKSNILTAARHVNDAMPRHTYEKILSLLPKDGGKVTILGCTYKNDVDDLRESPILKLADILLENNIEFSIYDPHVMNKEFKQKKYLAGTLEDALKDSSLIVLGVNHSLFKDIDFAKYRPLLKNAVMFDTRSFYDKSALESAGYAYVKLGCGK